MKKVIVLFLSLCVMLGVIACGTSHGNVAGKRYTYEKGGFGGAFSITLNEDGTFTYYEGMLSSYIGIGTWEQNGSTVILQEDDEMGYGFVNYFQISGDDLVFISEDSDNFLYTEVLDGDIFYGEPISTKVQ